ncbi:hypothetical protein PICSAR10_04631 [Mycobacterium avium subsp. paratuberculosis]|nr:hypothetical protein PICSAR10_04631 [Mycobacterium avium subsp. paratuberculosis]
MPAGAGADEAAGCTGDGEPAGAYAGVATRAGPAGPGVAALCSGVVLAASVTAYCSAPPFINCTNWLWKAAAWADSA